jgi:hypothetical protein
MTAIRSLSIAAALSAGLLLPAAAAAQVSGCPRHTEFPGLPERVAFQEFGGGEATTAWRVSFEAGSGYGLLVTSAHFRPDPDAEWVKVLDHAGLADVLVAGAGRNLDLSAGGFSLVALTRQQVGPCARILGGGYVAREVRDAGPLWLTPTHGARDGRMVLWAGLRAAGHAYMISYGFGADGSVEFRLADVGHGQPSGEGGVVLQDAVWRVDVDLGGPEGDSALITRLARPEGAAAPVVETSPVGDGSEAGVDWSGEDFTVLRVRDAELANAAGMPTSLDVMVLQRGLSRAPEGPAMHDFWVTAAKSDEIWAAALPSYVDGESIEATDIVVWVKTAMASEQSAEQGRCAGPDQVCEAGTWVGATPVVWTGFDLRLRNIFDGTPFQR